MLHEQNDSNPVEGNLKLLQQDLPPCAAGFRMHCVVIANMDINENHCGSRPWDLPVVEPQ
jgi:hypothetical protein